MLVEIVSGFYCDPEKVAVVKTIGKKQCALFISGQSAVDGGFLLNHPAKKVAGAVNEEGEEDDEGEGDEGQEDEGQEDEEEEDDD